MGVKDRRTKILLALFLLNDIKFDYSTFDEKIQKIFDFSLNQKTKGTISALLKEELIEKHTDSADKNADNADNKVSAYKLTKKGFAELSLKFPFFRFLVEKWDQKWRIISYEIPEKKRNLRDRLRREMAGWGLGPWHRSFWVTPHAIINNLRELTFQKEEEKFIQAFESEHIYGDRPGFIEKVWGTSVLDKKYRVLFKKWHETLSKAGEKEHKFRTVIADYLAILRDDPGLPSQLLGESWIGYEAFNIFKEIRGILLA